MISSRPTAKPSCRSGRALTARASWHAGSRVTPARTTAGRSPSAEAITAYEADLTARAGDPYNAKRARVHVPTSAGRQAGVAAGPQRVEQIARQPDSQRAEAGDRQPRAHVLTCRIVIGR